MSQDDDFGWSGPAPKGLVGHDFNRFANAVGRKLEAEHAQKEAREREALDLRRELASRTYFVAVRHIIGKGADPVEIETCESLPIVGRLKATGRHYDHALSNLWLGIAKELLKHQAVEHDEDEGVMWERARVMAVERFSFLPSMGDSRIVT